MSDNDNIVMVVISGGLRGVAGGATAPLRASLVEKAR